MTVGIDLPLLTMRRQEAMMAFEEGRLPDADNLLCEVVGMLQGSVERPSRAELARCLNDRATVRRYANRWAEALADLDDAVEQAEALAPLPRRAALTAALSARAGLLARADTGVSDLDRATTDLVRLRELGLAGWLVGEIECQIAYQLRDWPAVATASPAVIEQFEREGFPVAVAFARLRAAEALAELGQDDRAAAEVALARTFLDQHGPPDRLAAALLLDGRLSARRGDHLRALDLVDRALGELEKLIRHFRSLNDQQRFVGDKLRYYAPAFDLALGSGGVEAAWRAWSVAERAKSFYLSQLMANADVGLFDGLDPGVAGRLRALDQELDALEVGLAHAEPEARERLVEDQARVRREYNQLVAEAMRSNPRWASLRTPAPVDVAAAVRTLPEGWSVLSHFWRSAPDGHVLHLFFSGAAAGSPTLRSRGRTDSWER